MFSGIIGHDHHKDYFKKVLTEGTLAHAYCFEGISGTGKFTFARAMARHLICGNDPKAQLKFDTYNHPDIQYMSPSGASIKVEQVEDLQAFINVKPYLADIKIIIIDGADTMTDQAQNKLLKTLEEPPGHAVIFLIASTYTRLLSTIRSRVIRTPFGPLGEDHLKNLASHHDLTPSQDLLAVAQGSFGKMVKWSTDQTFTAGINRIYTMLDQVFSKQAGKWLSHLDVFEELKDDSTDVLDVVLLWLSDALMVVSGAPKELLRLTNLHQSMVQCTQGVSTQAILNAMDAVEQAKVALTRQQNYTLVTESMMFKIQEAIHG